MSGQFGAAFPAQPGFSAQPPLFAPAPTPFGAAQSRKRRAPSPPTDPSPSHWIPPETKRRRPNLHNGFATMSITPRPDEGESAPPRPQQYASHVDDDGPDDDGLEPTRPPSDGDVAVEVLSDKHPSPTQRRRPLFPQRHSSFSSTSPSEEDYESDVTFRPPLERARLRQAHHTPMQPTSVEHPEQADLQPGMQFTPTVEPLESPLKRKHLVLDERGDGTGHSAKRQRPVTDMDGDMDMDGSGPVASGPGWYEPEKDRIVITSLSSPESVADRLSRSPSPDSGPRRYSYEEHKKLAQPGDDGFTISPSLLTHLMAAQSDQFRPDSLRGYAMNPERGLVLYRPLGIPPAEDVVQQWDQQGNARFEEVDDDEDLRDDAPVVGVPMDMGQWGSGGWGEQPQWGGGGGGGDDAMDIE